MVKIAAKIEKRGDNKYRLNVFAGYDPSGKQIIHRKTITVANVTEAKNEYKLFAADVARGMVSLGGNMSLHDFYQYWTENYALQNHEVRTLQRNAEIFTRIDKHLGAKQLAKIEPKHILEFYKALAKPGEKMPPGKKKKKTEKKEETAKAISEASSAEQTKTPKVLLSLSGSTIQKHHKLLSTLLNAAVKWQLIFSNPCSRVGAPKAKPKKIPILTLEQTSTFLAGLDGEPLKYKLLAILALTTGLRRGELMALEWEHFDLKAKTLEVKKSFVYLAGPDKGLILKDPKTEESQRIIAIPETLIELLSQHKAKQNEKRLKLGEKWQSGVAEKWKEHNFVFTTWNGGPMHLDSFGIWLDKYLVKVDLPHISPHSFRHMAATFSLAAGKSLKSVSSRLGHSRPSTTSDIYAHALKTVDREIADQMNDLVEAAKNKQTESQSSQKA